MNKWTGVEPKKTSLQGESWFDGRIKETRFKYARKCKIHFVGQFSTLNRITQTYGDLIWTPPYYLRFAQRTTTQTRQPICSRQSPLDEDLSLQRLYVVLLNEDSWGHFLQILDIVCLLERCGISIPERWGGMSSFCRPHSCPACGTWRW